MDRRVRGGPLAWLGWMLCVVVACQPGGGGSTSNPSDKPVPTEQEAAWAREVHRLVNEARAQHGRAALEWSTPLAEVAFDHCVDMRDRHYLDHHNPEGQGPAERVGAVGIGFHALGENIAQGQPTPEQVMAGWMGSPGHRANILDADFTQVGVGASQGEGGPWWTQVFIRP